MHGGGGYTVQRLGKDTGLKRRHGLLRLVCLAFALHLVAFKLQPSLFFRAQLSRCAMCPREPEKIRSTHTWPPPQCVYAMITIRGLDTKEFMFIPHDVYYPKTGAAGRHWISELK